MERLLLCSLVLLRPLDTVDAATTQGPSFQAKTTRGLPLCPEGNGHQPQHLDGPADQGTPCSSLTTGSMATRLDWSRWPTDGSLETKDSLSFKDDRWNYWTDKTIDLLLVLGAMLLSLLICWCLLLFWRAFYPVHHQPERNRLLTTPSLNGQGEYGAIMDADETLPCAAKGQVSPPIVEKEDHHYNGNKATLSPKSVSETAL